MSGAAADRRVHDAQSAASVKSGRSRPHRGTATSGSAAANAEFRILVESGHHRSYDETMRIARLLLSIALVGITACQKRPAAYQQVNFLSYDCQSNMPAGALASSVALNVRGQDVALDHGSLSQGGPGEFVDLENGQGLRVSLVHAYSTRKFLAVATKLSAPSSSDYALMEKIIKTLPVGRCKKTSRKWSQPGWSPL